SLQRGTYLIMGQHGLPVAECPRCGCEFDPAVTYTIRQLADRLQVRPKTIWYWMAIGRLRYRVRPISGAIGIRIIDAYRVTKFLDTYWPDPQDDPDGTSLAHRLWRKGRRHAEAGTRSSVLARRARRQVQGAEEAE